MTNTYDNLVNDIIVENLTRPDAIDDTDDPPKKLSLEELDHKLENDIDEDFFEEPVKFTKTLNRVIDVLGAQFHDGDGMEGESEGGGAVDMTKNPAYRSLQRQMNVVESAIEQVAMAHSSELNESVVGIGKVAREFNEAVSVVKKLRNQVKQIKRSLNPSISNGDIAMNGKDGLSGGDDVNSTEVVATTAKEKSTNISLRELWMKKLECEAVLSILDKLVIVRDAPSGFDALIEPRNGSCCRIIAAVTLLSNAISTMNSDDLSQVMAVTKVYQQLMSRKQRAEEIVWDTLNDVVYLRTGNSKQAALLAEYAASKKKKRGAGHLKSMVPGFYRSHYSTSTEDQSVSQHPQLQESDDSSDDDITEVSSRGEGYTASMNNHCKRVIPKTYLEEEIDLEEEEKICLEDASSVPWDPRYPNEPILFRPKFSDATLALRLLTEAITKLRRLDDVERYLNESVEAELKRIAEREQMRTLALLEKRRGHRLPNVATVSSTSNSSAVAGTSTSAVSNYKRQQPLPMEFKHHLSSLLFAYGNVMLRLSHLAQIIRYKIASDSTIATPSCPSPSSALHSVLTSAFSIMQREIKLFLRSCVEAPSNFLSAFQNNNNHNRNRGAGAATNAFNQSSEEYADERGIFSLGVIEQSSTDKKTGGRGNYSHHHMSDAGLTADAFVTSVLLPKTHTSPQPRFALSFRRVLERWTYDCMQLKNELALISNEEQTFDSSSSDDAALKYLDSVIESKLLINLQDHALQNIVAALEKPDSFDPDLDSSHHHSSSGSKDALMCLACKKLLENIMPLLTALHRLPRGEKMATAVAAVLDMAFLAFLSRVKQRVQELCTNKTAYEFMGSYDSATTPGTNKSDSLSAAMETRRAYTLFLQEYYGHDSIDDSTSNLQANNSNNTTATQNTNSNTPNAPTFDNFTSDLEKENKSLAKEVENIVPLLKFPEHDHGYNLHVCTEEDLKKSSCLAHSLLQLSVVLIASLQNKKTRKWKKTCTKSLRNHLITIQNSGIFMAKFCRMDMLVQTVKRMAQISKSSSIVSKDTIRLPACVNDLGEYLSNASDILRDAAGNALAAYSFSSLEQYIPLLLMQSVRFIASDGTIIALNGIESLDRCGSVLYRDLKGATGFEGSFWDETAAADSFERSASFLALLELTMEELEQFWRENTCVFSDEDYKLLFSIHCPRRTGDLPHYARLRDDLIMMQGNASSASNSRKGRD